MNTKQRKELQQEVQAFIEKTYEDVGHSNFTVKEFEDLSAGIEVRNPNSMRHEMLKGLLELAETKNCTMDIYAASYMHKHECIVIEIVSRENNQELED